MPSDARRSPHYDAKFTNDIADDTSDNRPPGDAIPLPYLVANTTDNTSDIRSPSDASRSPRHDANVTNDIADNTFDNRPPGSAIPLPHLAGG